MLNNRPRRYRSLTEFYANPARWASAEQDLGLRWIDSAGRTYRAAWISGTEEVYCVQHLGVDAGGGSVRVLGRFSAEQLERAFVGWEDVCGERRSHEWLCEHATRSGGQGQQRRRNAPSPPQRRRPRLPLMELPGRRAAGVGGRAILR
jgi:hypothetical protein